MDAHLAYRFSAKIGESPRWDSRRERLMWVDIDGQLLCFFDPTSGINIQHHIGSSVGVAVFAEQDQIALALKDRFVLFDEKTGITKTLATIESGPTFRFNDGGVDPAGRFYAGTMQVPSVPRTAHLYSIDQVGRVVTQLSEVGLTNGMAWSLDGKKFYFTDTTLGNIREFDYNIEDGAISKPRVIFELPRATGLTDGLVIDAEGCLWLAVWGGGQVLRLTTSGRIISKIDLPVSQVSSMGFGGKNLDQLFITSATFQLSQGELLRQPLAGSLFVADVGVQGIEQNYFKTPKGD